MLAFFRDIVFKKIPATEDLGVRVVWAISRVLAPVLWLSAPVFLAAGGLMNIVTTLAIPVIFTLPLVLIRLGRKRAAKQCFLFELVLVAVLLPLQDGRNASMEWVVILIPLVAYVIFDREWHWLWLGIGLVGYILIQAIYRFHTPWMEPVEPEFYQFTLAVSVCVFVYWLVVVFKQDTLRSESVRLAQHRELLENQAIIAKQNEELRHFAHAVSHDLKEPLRNIGSFSTLLSRRIGDDPAKRELLGFIETGAKRMAFLLDDLINYAQVGIENAPAEPIDLNTVLREVETNLALQQGQAAGRIEAMPLPLVVGHAALLTQLLQNIVSNGLKYRRSDVPPVVQIRYLRKDGNLLLVFRDNGIGIEPQNLGKIFEPFRRLHNRSEFDGSGIGLATCRKIVEQYNGRIWAESTAGEGTAIMVELPEGMLFEESRPKLDGPKKRATAK